MSKRKAKLAAAPAPQVAPELPIAPELPVAPPYLRPTTVLMGSDNPVGWKLEELLRQIAAELVTKNAKIADDARPEARQVHENNLRIMRLCEQGAALQDENMTVVARLGPNQGPLGRPRIGVGA